MSRLTAHAGLAETVVLEEALWRLLFLHDVLCTDCLQTLLLRRFLHLAAEHELVENEIRLLEVENDVQLAHGPKVLVEQFHVAMNDLECEQLVVFLLDGTAEVQ